MLKALGNVAPRHLLDTRLNPPGDLVASVKAHDVLAQERESRGRRISLSPRPSAPA
jgi:hypothetical protein